jgi:energy coupling factor transporter S component ThiW
MQERRCSFVTPFPLKRLTAAGLFVAAALLLSGIHIPLGPTKCFPFQHTVNALAGALLGPWWAAGIAAVTSLLRLFTGTGTLFAFPGSIPGALAAGFAFRWWKKDWAVFAEPLGTGPVGASLAALLLGPAMGGSVGIVSLNLAFLASSLPGATVAFLLLHLLRQNQAFRKMAATL